MSTLKANPEGIEKLNQALAGKTIARVEPCADGGSINFITTVPDATGDSTGMTPWDIDSYADWVVAMWFSKAVQGEPHFEKNPELRSLFIMTAGLGGELGEVLEKVKKHVRDGNLDRENLKKELGDVLYYLVRLMRYFGFQPSEVLAANVEKLESRRERGVLRGSGDNR